MKAIETTGTFENGGLLRLDNIGKIESKKVKVILLFNDDDEIDEQLWLNAHSKNPAFDFLKDEKEDIYTLADGNPIS